MFDFLVVDYKHTIDYAFDAVCHCIELLLCCYKLAVFDSMGIFSWPKD